MSTTSLGTWSGYNICSCSTPLSLFFFERERKCNKISNYLGTYIGNQSLKIRNLIKSTYVVLCKVFFFWDRFIMSIQYSQVSNMSLFCNFLSISCIITFWIANFKVISKRFNTSNRYYYDIISISVRYSYINWNAIGISIDNPVLKSPDGGWSISVPR